jgi:hypothetical protein
MPFLCRKTRIRCLRIGFGRPQQKEAWRAKRTKISELKGTKLDKRRKRGKKKARRE